MDRIQQLNYEKRLPYCFLGVQRGRVSTFVRKADVENPSQRFHGLPAWGMLAIEKMMDICHRQESCIRVTLPNELSAAEAIKKINEEFRRR